MAELARPQTVVTQTNAASEVDVATPTQQAVIVGPLFEIVEPIDAQGAANASAQIVTAARVESTAAVADPAAVAGKSMLVSINGNPSVAVNFPPTTGAGLSHTLIIQKINAALTGVIARFVDNKLVLETEGKGSSASIQLLTVPAPGTAAYGDLNLTDFVDVQVAGKDGYEGIGLEVPYNSVPSPRAPRDEIVFDSDEARIYAIANRVLVELFRDAAYNVNSHVGGPSLVGGGSAGVNATATDRTFAPAFGNARSGLYALPQVGPNSNKLLNVGVDAFQRIPLGEDFLGRGAANLVWPDMSGRNYLDVKARGLEPLLSGEAAGNYPGVAGNAVSVVLRNSGSVAGQVSAAWAGNVLTITVGAWDGVGPTFADLGTALNNAVGLDQTQHVELTLVYASTHAALPFVPALGTDLTFFLSGGQDPIDFGSDLGAGAGITGCVSVGAAATAADLGVDGEWLEIAVDGGDWQRFTLSGRLFDGGSGALDNIDGATATTVTVYPDMGSLVNGESVGLATTVIQIVSSGAATPDSSLAIRASSDLVIENLFGGRVSDTESIAATSTAGEGHVLALTAGSGNDYNTQAVAPLELGLVQGTVGIDLVNLTTPGAIFIPYLDVNAIADGRILEIEVNGSGTLDLPVNWTSAGSAALVRDDINADLGGGGAPFSDLKASVVTLGTAQYIVIADLSHTPGRQFRINSGGNTHADLVAALEAVLFDTWTTTEAGVTLSLNDGDENFAIQVNSISNGLSSFLVPAAITLSSVETLFELLIDDSGWLATPPVNYQSGAINLTLEDDSGDDSQPLFAKYVDGSSSVSLTYQKAAPNLSGAIRDYSNVLFTGGHVALKAGDLFYNNGQVQGRVVSFEDYVVAAGAGFTFSNAVVVLSEFTARGGAQLNDWYSVSYKLDEAGAAMSPMVTAFDAVEKFAIKSGSIRDGAGFARVGVLSPLHIGYKALRLDVTGSASDPALWLFDSLAEVDALWGPISPDNPLAFAMSLAFANNTTTQLAALGVDEVSADFPEGTPEGYQRAFEYLQKSTVPYFIAPLTQEFSVAQLLGTHVAGMSTGEQAKWRMGMVSFELPTEKFPVSVISDTVLATAIGGGKYELEFTEDGINLATVLNGLTGADGNPIAGIIGQVYGAETGLYVDFGGDAYKYRVSKLTAANILEIDTTDVFNPGGGPGTDGNDDGFYHLGTEYLAVFPAVGDTATINIRQAEIDLTTTTGKVAACQVLSDMASSLANRRMIAVGPHQGVVATAQGNVVVPGYYLTAALAGFAAATDPRDNLSGASIAGFLRLIGSNDLFEESGQLALAAGGGFTWLVVDGVGAAPVIRHFLTTDLTDLDTRQPAVTRQLDYAARVYFDEGNSFMRQRRVSRQTLDQFSLLLSTIQSRISGEGGQVKAVEVTSLGVVNRTNVGATISVTPWDALDGLDIELVF